MRDVAERKNVTIPQKLLAEALGTFVMTLAAMLVDILYYLGPNNQGHAPWHFWERYIPRAVSFRLQMPPD